jgi:hypothetical protein
MRYSFAVSSEYVEKELLIAPSLPGDGDESGQGYSSIQPLGLIARPRDPDQDDESGTGAGAGCLYLEDGGDTFVIPTTDPRALEKVPPLKPGGTALYSYPGGCLVFDGENGSLLVLVPNEDASKNHAISIDSATGSISILHAEGMGLAILNDAKHSISINNKAGDAGIVINDDGVTINGNLTLNGGAVLGVPTGGVAVPLITELVTLVAALKVGLTVPGVGVAQLSPAFPDPVGSSKVAVSP